jgi:hypothetical protein
LHIFIDESGTFIPETGWAVVCSLAIPHTDVGPARREIGRLSRDWPRQDGELKGGILGPSHLQSLVEVLFRRDALMHACAIDVSREDNASVDRHKARQCDGMTKHLTADHHPDLVRQVWDLRRVLEGMPRQLYIQCITMTQLVRIASEEVTLYFAQRRPREIAQFEWTMDAKDPRRITSQEKWWREALAPLLESGSRREPFIFVKDAAFNYKYFDRSFAMKTEMWFRDRPPQMMEGHDIKKMTTERMAFVDSRSELMIQADGRSDKFFAPSLGGGHNGRRCLARTRKIADHHTPRGHEHPQSLRVLTLSDLSDGPSDVFATLGLMTKAARSLFKPERTRRRRDRPRRRTRRR